jgi:hypothetical protein
MSSVSLCGKLKNDSGLYCSAPCRCLALIAIYYMLFARAATPAGLLVLLTAAALLTWRQRRHRKHSHQGLLPLPPGPAQYQDGAGAGLLAADLDAYVQSGDQGMQGGGPRQEFLPCHGMCCKSFTAVYVGQCGRRFYRSFKPAAAPAMS